MLLIPLLAGRSTSAPCLFINDSKFWLHRLSFSMGERLGVQGHHDLVSRPTTEMHSQPENKADQYSTPIRWKKVQLSLSPSPLGGREMQVEEKLWKMENQCWNLWPSREKTQATGPSQG